MTMITQASAAKSAYERVHGEPALPDHPRDFRGRVLLVGDRVARAVRHGSQAAYLEERTITAIEDGKVYLDGSTRPCLFTDRMVRL